MKTSSAALKTPKKERSFYPKAASFALRNSDFWLLLAKPRFLFDANLKSRLYQAATKWFQLRLILAPDKSET
jgi:hypothetical protein